MTMENEATGVNVQGDDLPHGLNDEAPAHVVGQCPTDHAAGAQVDDDGKVSHFTQQGMNSIPPAQT